MAVFSRPISLAMSQAWAFVLVYVTLSRQTFEMDAITNSILQRTEAQNCHLILPRRTARSNTRRCILTVTPGLLCSSNVTMLSSEHFFFLSKCSFILADHHANRILRNICGSSSCISLLWSRFNCKLPDVRTCVWSHFLFPHVAWGSVDPSPELSSVCVGSPQCVARLDLTYLPTCWPGRQPTPPAVRT